MTFMKKKKCMQTTKRLKPSLPLLSKAELDRLVEEATVDCYNESEQATGLYTMIEENLQLPFETEVLGVAVTVVAIDITDDDQIVAVCQRGGLKQKLRLLELPLPTSRPAGSECIDAYRHWARGG
jgi:hypothetical protein